MNLFDVFLARSLSRFGSLHCSNKLPQSNQSKTNQLHDERINNGQPNPLHSSLQTTHTHTQRKKGAHSVREMRERERETNEQERINFQFEKDLGHLSICLDALNFHPSVFCFGLVFSEHNHHHAHDEIRRFYDTFRLEHLSYGFECTFFGVVGVFFR